MPSAKRQLGAPTLALLTLVQKQGPGLECSATWRAAHRLLLSPASATRSGVRRRVALYARTHSRRDARLAIAPAPTRQRGVRLPRAALSRRNRHSAGTRNLYRPLDDDEV